MDAFVYCWTNIETNQLYVGSHKGTPDDGYVCSSKPMLEDFKNNPNVFVRQIIASGTHDDMVALETAILISADAKNDLQFYNMHNNNGKFIHNQPHTSETKSKMSIAHKNRAHYAKGHKFGTKELKNHKEGLGRYWSSLSPEERKIQAEKRESQKKKDSLTKRNHTVKECPHCGKTGNGFGMDRWHMNNCRYK